MESESTHSRALDDVRELLAHTGALDVRGVDGAALPEPYRALLVHERDMTGELEAFSRSTIHIRPLEVRRAGELLERRVLLVCDEGQRTVEFGAIRIHLDGFTGDAREEVLSCRTPLGGILRKHALDYVCRPRLFFELHGESPLPADFRVADGEIVYGRVNRIEDSGGRPLADVVEVLPRLDDFITGTEPRARS